MRVCPNCGRPYVRLIVDDDGYDYWTCDDCDYEWNYEETEDESVPDQMGD